jgi:hypothetical protein
MHGQKFSPFLLGVVLGLVLSACSGGSPARYDPGPVATPTGLFAVAGNGEVALNWAPAQNAAAYNVYWSTSSTVDEADSSVTTTTGTSLIVTGLSNGTTYYFAVTGVNAYTQTPESAIVTAQPTATDFGLVDLDGTWNFNILVSGQAPGWMQGQVTISSGVVTFNSFLDSSGNTVPPADLFATWSILPDGSVSQSGTTTNFSGALSNNPYRDTLVGIAQWRGASSLIAVVQKQVSSVTFGSGDIEGVGGNSGPKFFVYNQISSGAIQEWEFEVAKLDQSSGVKLIAFDSSDHATSTFPALPVVPGPGYTFRSVFTSPTSSVFSINPSTGKVTETVEGGTTLPPAGCSPQGVCFQGIMSADKTLMVGTFTDSRYGTAADQGSRKYALRIYQIVNALVNDYGTPPTYDLSKPYNVLKLGVGSTVLSGEGAMQLNATTTPAGSSGLVSFSSYSDSVGGSLPADSYFAFTAITWNSNKTISAPLGAILTDPGSGGYAADPTFYGKVSRYSDLVAWTRTEPDGARSLTLGMQRPQ